MMVRSIGEFDARSKAAAVIEKPDARAHFRFALTAIWGCIQPKSRGMARCMWTIADMALAGDQGYPFRPSYVGQCVYWYRKGVVLTGRVTSLVHEDWLSGLPARVTYNRVSYRPHITDYCDSAGARAKKIMVKRPSKK